MILVRLVAVGKVSLEGKPEVILAKYDRFYFEVSFRRYRRASQTFFSHFRAKPRRSKIVLIWLNMPVGLLQCLVGDTRLVW